MIRRTWALAVALAMSAPALVQGASIVEWKLEGSPGNQATSSPTFEESGIDGLLITRGAGLTPTAANHSFSASGWNDLAANDYFQLGFNITDGSTWLVEQFILATRSSATGPGRINIDLSIDGGAFTTLTTLVQPDPATTLNNGFVNSILDVNQVVTSSLVIRLYAASNIAANGGTIGSAGTFRIGDYYDGQLFSPLRLTGQVRSSVVPEPASAALLALGGVIFAGAMRIRRRG